MNIQNNGYLSIGQLADQYLNRPKGTESRENGEGLSFQEILQKKSLESLTGNTDAAGSLKFSKHALGRLNDRNIELNTEQLERLNDGARKAKQKGIRDSLVIVDRLAFIVNVPNQTVVTAMDSTATDENIFTNINGAVIA
ncbi:MAG: flagellar protein [bacterium]|nr:flagellar protein [bacterium]